MWGRAWGLWAVCKEGEQLTVAVSRGWTWKAKSLQVTGSVRWDFEGQRPAGGQHAVSSEQREEAHMRLTASRRSGGRSSILGRAPGMVTGAPS